jgi:hypothetical protein
MVRWLAVLLAFVLVAPATASAAELRVVNGVLTYTAGPGLINDVTFGETIPAGTVRVTRDAAVDDKDPITTAAGCFTNTPQVDYTCAGVTRVVADVGDQSDRITADQLHSVTAVLSGGDGNDALDSGSGHDTLTGGPGDDLLDGSTGDDHLDGGHGNDTLHPDLGTDGLIGGEGIDTAVYGYRDKPAAYSLDGRNNDGETGENDTIGADVENVFAPADRASQLVVTITGDGRANHLRVTDGRGDVTGGDGSDVLEGGPRDDILRARDGTPDRVICGPGTDTVEADTVDIVSPTCENVSTQATPGGTFDDRPPAIVWTAPGAGASLSANTASTLSVNAADDRGLARVQFFDDDRLLCEVAAAPFTCAFQPRGSDVGRNTLIAVAVDGANQTTSVVRPVNVRRFSAPGLSLSLRPSRDRRPPFAFRATGTLRRPATVSPSQGCSGRVTIRARAGRRTVSTRRATLSRNCEYGVILRFRSRVARRVRLTARFGGNDALSTRGSRSRTIRLG